jgi:hypothetical protein
MTDQMSPERIEEVQKLLSTINQKSQQFPITEGDLSSLLAALTDAQQQNTLKNEALSNYEHPRKLLQAELAEAQQTIAR